MYRLYLTQVASYSGELIAMSCEKCISQKDDRFQDGLAKQFMLFNSTFLPHSWKLMACSYKYMDYPATWVILSWPVTGMHPVFITGTHRLLLLDLQMQTFARFFGQAVFSSIAIAIFIA